MGGAASVGMVRSICQAIDVVAHVHVIWFTQSGVTRCDGDHEEDVFSEPGCLSATSHANTFGVLPAVIVRMVRANDRVAHFIG
jgi:hypothetical protein